MYNSLNASYGPLSQTSFQFGTLSQKETNLNADFTYPVNLGLVQPGHAGVGRGVSQGNLRPDRGRRAVLWGGPYASRRRCSCRFRRASSRPCLMSRVTCAGRQRGIQSGSRASAPRPRLPAPAAMAAPARPMPEAGASGAGASTAMPKPTSPTAQHGRCRPL